MRLTLLLFSILFFYCSCGKIADEIPSYLRIDSTYITNTTYGYANPNTYGFVITVGNDNRGRWQLPFTMPILNEGAKTLILTPLVKINNLTNSFIPYPLYKIQEFSLNLIRGKTIDTIVHLDYVEGIDMTLYEDFEVTNRFNNSEISTNSRNDIYSLKMDATLSTSDSINVSTYYQPIAMSSIKDVYLEFDYYMPQGIFSPILSYEDVNNKRRDIYSENYLLPNTTWTHVYWRLNPLIRQNGQSAYSLAFLLTPQKGFVNAEVYIDNVRILEK